MKRNIVCFFVAALYLITLTSVLSAQSINTNSQTPNQLLNGYFIIGFMRLIHPDENRVDYDVVSFVILRGNGETIQLQEGEMIQIQGSMFLFVLNNFIMGYIGDYDIIR